MLCASHGRGESNLSLGHPPEGIIFAQNEQDVVDTVQLCRELGLPIIPYGAGSSLEGQLDALHGGVSLDLSRMNQLVSLNPDDMDCRVQAGMTAATLNRDLKDLDLFFPVDIGYSATLGGMAATRASWANAVRYGGMRELTLGLTVVTGEGRVVRTGGRTRKSASGYDLTRLYVGSEGTLGVITEVQLRLFGRPAHIANAVTQFRTIDDAINAVIVLLQTGVELSRIELLDDVQMGASLRYLGLPGLKPLPSLFLEYEGSEAQVAEWLRQTAPIIAWQGGTPMVTARTEPEREALWAARRQAYAAARALDRSKDCLATDVAVPISALSRCIEAALEAAARAELVTPLFGHVGDGNFHMLILYDPEDSAEVKRAYDLSSEVVQIALSLEGTCAGEHGIGNSKIGAASEEFGESVHVMQAIKRALDPDSILNPGKMFDLPGAPPGVGTRSDGPSL